MNQRFRLRSNPLWSVVRVIALCGFFNSSPATDAVAQSSLHLELPLGAETLPRSGPKAWCNRPDVIKTILLALSGTSAVRDSGEKIIDFKNSTTVQIDIKAKTAACRGIAHASNGQMLPGTFSIVQNAAGESIWKWMNDPEDEADPQLRSAAAQGVTLGQLPAEQAAFVEAVRRGKMAYETAKTDFAKGATRSSRMALICSALDSPTATSWEGKLVSLTTNSDGKGVIVIEIAPGVRLRTWSNTLSDINSDTLVEPGTRLFRSLGALNVSERVRFSGVFFPNKVDCVKEASVTMNGSMTDPEFIMKFTAIEQLSRR